MASTHREHTRDKPEAQGVFVGEKLMTYGDIEDELDDFEMRGTLNSLEHQASIDEQETNM